MLVLENKSVFEKILVVVNLIILGLTVLVACYLGISFLFKTQSNAFAVFFQMGMFLIMPVVIIFHLSSVAWLLGGVKQYWEMLYPVSAGLGHWGLYLLGSGKPGSLTTLAAIVAVSLVFMIPVIYNKIHYSKLFLITAIAIYWIVGLVPIVFLHQISPDLKMFIATSLMLISIRSAISSKK